MNTGKEIPISLQAKGATLEARFNAQSTTRAVVITHPHPLYGGNMDNNVVEVIAAAYAGQDWSTLRFNFRGTGRSTGSYADGIGEQEDVQAGIDYLLSKGYQSIDLAGYSFGAWVLAGWSRNHASHPYRLFLISPPVAFIEFDEMPVPGLRHVLTGAQDDLAPPGLIQKALPHWTPQARLTPLRGADHFFWGHEQQLQAELVSVIQ
ncbi:MAG: alpha/beta hydrolase [Desulfobacteraceae bacterium]|nr:alpha/beta hydrolase [Desulfobacteraceae bacterium]